MTTEYDDFERVISRHLDGETTPDEEQYLALQARADPLARRRLEEYRALDRQVGDALRRAIGYPARPALLRPPWRRVGRSVAVAAAACVAALLWLQPRTAPRRSGTDQTQQASAASWFAPAAPAVDTVEPTPLGFERPELGVRGTQRDWIVIPGDQPGSYFVIEVNHVRTHVISVHRDF
jgi:hypothetical protein